MPKTQVKPLKKKNNMPSRTPTGNRVSTGIEGIDEIISGGFEENSINLVGGGPGSGKSIFAMQFIVNGIEKFNENGVFVTFEETKEKIYKHMMQFGWDLQKYENENRFSLLEYTPEQVRQLLSEGGGLVENIISKIKAKRIAIDSLTGFSLLFKTEHERREAMLALFKMIAKWGCTAMVTEEEPTSIDNNRNIPLEFEVDGVILLYYIRRGNVRERAIEVLKLRGTKHSAKLYPLKITNKGIIVYPEEKVF